MVLYLRVFLYNEMSVNYLVAYRGIFYLVEVRDCFNNCCLVCGPAICHLASFPVCTKTTACVNQVWVLKTVFEKRTKPDL